MKMNTYTSVLLLAAVATTFAACGKLDMVTPDTAPPELPGTTTPVTGNNKIEGTWNFVGVKVNSVSTTTEGTMKAILRTNYVTTDNKGVCVIDGTNFIITGLTYSINTTTRTIMYLDGELVTDMDIPFVMTMDPYSARNPYKLIGADSIFFSKGVMEMPSGTGGTVEFQEAGGRISWLTDTLVLTMSTNQSVNGSYVTAREEMKFVKKP